MAEIKRYKSQLELELEAYVTPSPPSKWPTFNKFSSLFVFPDPITVECEL